MLLSVLEDQAVFSGFMRLIFHKTAARLVWLQNLYLAGVKGEPGSGWDLLNVAISCISPRNPQSRRLSGLKRRSVHHGSIRIFCIMTSFGILRPAANWVTSQGPRLPNPDKLRNALALGILWVYSAFRSMWTLPKWKSWGPAMKTLRQQPPQGAGGLLVNNATDEGSRARSTHIFGSYAKKLHRQNWLSASTLDPGVFEFLQINLPAARVRFPCGPRCQTPFGGLAGTGRREGKNKPWPCLNACFDKRSRYWKQEFGGGLLLSTKKFITWPNGSANMRGTYTSFQFNFTVISHWNAERKCRII